MKLSVYEVDILTWDKHLAQENRKKIRVYAFNYEVLSHAIVFKDYEGKNTHCYPIDKVGRVKMLRYVERNMKRSGELMSVIERVHENN